jgi:ribosomal protein S18 acetylase RimI-like enzyme
LSAQAGEKDMTIPFFTIRPLTVSDRGWVEQHALNQWGSDRMVAHGELFYISRLPGFAAEGEGQPLGLATYRITGLQCELASLDSQREGLGIGSALIRAVIDTARGAGCTRLFLVTTNDNTHALRFYQRRGFRLCALRPGAVEESRLIKPEIPLLGSGGIPIRDELELEMDL